MVDEIVRYGIGRDVNPDAGTHAIANDPAELAASAAATMRSWHEFPYYPRRYGERGWRFSLSDGGWLTTLCDSPAAGAREQVAWLGRLLAARGMPHLLLERHLGFLHEALLERLQGQAKRYARLPECAAFLRERRVAILAESRFESLARDFESATLGASGGIANFGAVLVAAVIDDRAGIPGVVESVTTWATDVTRFDERWCAAVGATLAAARAAI
ncbi:MAG TPA: hypothetical protein VMF52_00710 [Steroidobacteraceae bacterium]|nr:hypothetical protein [Steroidobacteraceae bacterium]